MTMSRIRYFRKVIRIRAADSPNVRYGMALTAAGREVPSGEEEIYPGVITYNEYLKRRATWDKVRQCIGLDAEFYEGAEVLLYPPEWLNLAEQVERVNRCRAFPTEAVGIDPAEGGDRTSLAAVNRWGVKELLALKTPDTNTAYTIMMNFIHRHNVRPEKVVLDRGGGGKEHADRMRANGMPVVTVAFGEAVSLLPKRGLRLLSEKVEQSEQRYAYFNRRAEMYGDFRLLLDPGSNPEGFALPPEYTELRHQMAPIPLQYNEEGRMILMPKNKRDPKSKIMTLTELIGHSPDELDSVVLGIHGMVAMPAKVIAGAIVR